MGRAEALDILGLQEGASAEEIEAAYKALIVKNHPDQGGTDWLAARLNEARDILLDD
jgi:curved DNA-binding protein CbpA